MKMIANDSLEVLRTCRYPYNEKLDAFVSDNLYLSVVTTNACQMRCPYCINSNTDGSLNMPLEEAEKNISKAAGDLGIKEAVILGGEPTLYPDLLKLIRFLKDNVKLRRVGITTNGISLKESPQLLTDMINAGIDFLNISYHRDGQFLTCKDLIGIRGQFLHDTTPGMQKMRINTNVWRGNHDTLPELTAFLRKISDVCDEIRVSNIIRKDGFSVNPVNNPEADKMFMEDWEYEDLFTLLIRTYAPDIAVIHNEEALGFVNYYLIPTATPVIVNWNIDSKVSEQICENDFTRRRIHTVKCLVNGKISLSWNTNHIIY